MRITYQHRFSAPLEQVVAMFRDESYARERALAAGATDADIATDDFEDGAFTVAVRRTVPSTSIPSEFRSFISSELVVRYTEAWAAPTADESSREGTFAVEILGAPGHARGSLVLKADGDGTAFGIAGDLQANVPLVGALVEQAIGGAITKSLPLELAAADAWLASRA